MRSSLALVALLLVLLAIGCDGSSDEDDLSAARYLNPDAQLEQDRGVPGLDRIVYGVIGDKFVVASDRELARAAAKMPTTQAAPAGARLRVDITRILREAGETEDGPRLLDALVEATEVHASAAKGDIVIQGTARLAPR